jgi:hypothetical protein
MSLSRRLDPRPICDALLAALGLWLAAPRARNGRSPTPPPCSRSAARRAAICSGWLVVSVGDVDGDSVPDFAVASPFFDSSGHSSAGKVSVHVGPQRRRALAPDHDRDPSAILGFSLAPRSRCGRRRRARGRLGCAVQRQLGRAAMVYSGRTGTVLKTFVGEAAMDSLGPQCGGRRRLRRRRHRDPRDRGAPDVDSTSADAGRVYVYSTAGSGSSPRSSRRSRASASSLRARVPGRHRSRRPRRARDRDARRTRQPHGTHSRLFLRETERP